MSKLKGQIIRASALFFSAIIANGSGESFSKIENSTLVASDKKSDAEHEHWTYLNYFGWVFTPYISKPHDNGHWNFSTILGWFFEHSDYSPYIYITDIDSWIKPVSTNCTYVWFFEYTTNSFRTPQDLPSKLEVNTHRILQQAKTMMRNTAASIPHTNQFPIYTVGPNWHLVGSWNWTAGFWPGCLWLMYDFSGDEYWRESAEAWTESMTSQKDNTTTHDLGFMMYNSFGQGLRLGVNSDEYSAVLHEAADSLFSRFNTEVGAIRSWSWGDWDAGNRFTVIVDNMMNLELLFWSARERDDPEIQKAAIEHARTTIRDFCRPDGSTVHVVVYNENNGEILEKLTHQGYSDDSTWARGQAWALYGFTTVYRESGLDEFLYQAKANADYYLEHFLDKGVPYWDVDAPVHENTPHDTSAAAIAASGLLELASLCRAEYPGAAKRYSLAAHHIIEALISPQWFAAIPDSNALLAGGTYNQPANHSNTGLIWGDYYLLEALLRYLKPDRIPTSPVHDLPN
ncbi:MAG: glycoside hydrolase family 88 protein [Opitutales bacterium]|nr:glycoside hydrolase family 88 protein [Opitutales bacterium]